MGDREWERKKEKRDNHRRRHGSILKQEWEKISTCVQNLEATENDWYTCLHKSSKNEVYTAKIHQNIVKDKWQGEKNMNITGYYSSYIKNYNRNKKRNDL